MIEYLKRNYEIWGTGIAFTGICTFLLLWNVDFSLYEDVSQFLSKGLLFLLASIATFFAIGCYLGLLVRNFREGHDDKEGAD